MVTIEPVTIKEKTLIRIENGIKRYIYQDMFMPIFSILKGKEYKIFNSINAIIEALKSGRIYYADGYFVAKDKFSNEVSKELESIGAVFKGGRYFLKDLPVEIQSVISLLKTQTAIKLKAIYDLINSDNYGYLNEEEIDKFIDVSVKTMVNQISSDMQKHIEEKTVPLIKKDFVSGGLKPLQPVLQTPQERERINEFTEENQKQIEEYWKQTDAEASRLHDIWANLYRSDAPKEQIKKASEELREYRIQQYHNAPTFDYGEAVGDNELIAKNYTFNMRFWVKKWKAKEIPIMRKDVLEFVQKGAREEEIAEYFQKRWKIAEGKASFLARNESTLVKTAITEVEAKRKGSKAFKWGFSRSKCRRKLHQKYYNHTFSYDAPPLIDERLKIYGLPGQIWNCRCHLKPIITIKDLMEAERNGNNIINCKQRKHYTCEYKRFADR